MYIVLKSLRVENKCHLVFKADEGLFERIKYDIEELFNISLNDFKLDISTRKYYFWYKLPHLKRFDPWFEIISKNGISISVVIKNDSKIVDSFYKKIFSYCKMIEEL